MAQDQTLGKGVAGCGAIWCCPYPDILTRAPSPSSSGTPMSEGARGVGRGVLHATQPRSHPSPGEEVPGHPASFSQSMHGPWPPAASSALGGAVVKEKSRGSASGEDPHEQ